MARKVQEKPLRRRELMRAISSRDRDVFQPALELALDLGHVTKTGDVYC